MHRQLFLKPSAIAVALATALVTTMLPMNGAHASDGPTSQASIIRHTSLLKRELTAPLRTPKEILDHFQPRLTHDAALAKAFEQQLVRAPELPKVPSRWKAWGLKALHVPAIAAVPAALALPSYLIGWGSEDARTLTALTTLIGTIVSAGGVSWTYGDPDRDLTARIRKKVSARNNVIAKREEIGANALIVALAHTDNADLRSIAADALQTAKGTLQPDDPADLGERFDRAIAASRENETQFNTQQATAAKLAEGRKEFKIPPSSR